MQIATYFLIFVAPLKATPPPVPSINENQLVSFGNDLHNSVRIILCNISNWVNDVMFADTSLVHLVFKTPPFSCFLNTSFLLL